MSLETEKNIEEGQTEMAEKPEQVTEEMSDEVEGVLPEQDFDDTDELIVEQQKRIQELEEELNKVKDSQLRKAAEMENMRKRMRREREQIFQTAREAALEAFLPINDDLVRTLQAMKENEADSSYVDGVQLIANKFEDVLEKHNVKRIDETGVPFDVDLHDAMLRQKPDDDSIESGTVLQVLENGYRIGDKTLRHAKVIVSE
ncbi:nucleotide exchange factor GrpE [Rhodohalobacter sulfatireducens]|uniref:Protein GrpE n=1 Tax=Rhodohalobacter sulfatireducens TaxID=2911366 RepID=A0ABS9KBG8_9BACT|nr:nucleotide exchange factor GrpE [Rhodohalobacter sulfatireducens]MCG2588170.1 nucleotide exchange factor GrpE [Rhodohalobacter sulfatireducens]